MILPIDEDEGLRIVTADEQKILPTEEFVGSVTDEWQDEPFAIDVQ